MPTPTTAVKVDANSNIISPPDKSLYTDQTIGALTIVAGFGTDAGSLQVSSGVNTAEFIYLTAANVTLTIPGTSGTLALLSDIPGGGGSTVPVANGGTGLTSYAAGDIIYASGTTTLSKLADVATGNALISGGVGVAPSWGKIGISTHVSGLGTGVATFLGTPSSANLLSAITDETGTGLLVFNAAPTITNPVIANIAPGANFTITQNSVAALTSVNSGAVVNTLYLTGGKVGIQSTTINSAYLEIPGSTTNSSVKIGALEIQPFALNNQWFGDNVYFNGSNFVTRATGQACWLYFLAGGVHVEQSQASVSAGGTVSRITPLSVLANGSVGLGGNGGLGTSLTGHYVATAAAGGLVVGTANMAATPGDGYITAIGLNLDKTITAGGTTGARTINKQAGSVNFAAAATSLVVTNSLVTANSVILCTVATNDGTLKSVQAVATSGSFTMYANAAATAETRVNFLVIN